MFFPSSSPRRAKKNGVCSITTNFSDCALSNNHIFNGMVADNLDLVLTLHINFPLHGVNILDFFCPRVNEIIRLNSGKK